jgi:hypothetical protein
LTRYVLEQKVLALGTLMAPIGCTMLWIDILLDLV